ncbi:NUDIX domain-containing protein [Actinoplanes sp. NPDC049548]|uniref:NUDIX hydrolase n=1 Tax=Actinoplanes sp. NPDC049548 TaxID=3155152 RepID=UPI0034306E8C
MEPPTHRPAARIVCLDADGRVLLLHWRDPHDGHDVWEPPGGGLDPGENHLQAARRELAEETGLDPAAVLDHSVEVERDFVWKGRHFAGPERFFLARFPDARPALARDGLLADEQQELAGHAWVAIADLAGLPGLDPPDLPQIIARL